VATEQHIQQEIRLKFGAHPDVRVFRNNTGQAWAGRAMRISSYQTVNVGPGDVVIRNARPFHAGLAIGSSDLIGFRATTITEDHLGRRLGVFAALEVKTPKGRTTDEQRAFLATVTRFGGFAGIVRSTEDAGRVLGVPLGS
jgi:hypothetical protein